MARVPALGLAAVALISAAAAPLSNERVLLVFAPARTTPALTEQDRLLSGERAGLVDRDLVVMRIVGRQGGGKAGAAALRQHYGVAPAAFAVRLIGKDGHVAVRSDRPVDPATLFETIDAMPMRRDELRARGR